MSKIIINAKGPKELKEAIRIVAFNERKSSSAVIISALEQNVKIFKEYKKLKTC